MKAVKNPDRYTKDENGQWWYAVPGHSRKRVLPRPCPWCKEEFLSPDTRQGFCGHRCAAASRQAGVAPTTKEKKGGPELRNSDNPRYSKDGNGQWWYKPIGTKDHGRTRASIKNCEECKSPFLCCVFHRRDARYCSKSCSLKATNAKNKAQYRNGRKGTNWRGGRIKAPNGYVWVYDPEAAQRHRPGTKKPYVLEHRLVVEKALGRPLLPEENVHHKNGVRDDNRPENLELWTKCQLPGQRVKDLIEFAKWVLETYGPLEAKLE